MIAPGSEEAAQQHFSACMRATREEPGNIRYEVFRSNDQPRKFILFEQYEDEATFMRHRETPHFVTHIKNGILKMMESRLADKCTPLG